MAGTNLGFPFDEEIFNYSWKTQPDLYLTNMINSGAVVRDAEIQNLISNGSNYFTTPYYDTLTGTEGDTTVYNGVNDIPVTGLTGGSYSGVVYGRQQGWDVKSFIKDFNSGADPMAQIVKGVANYWNKERQKRLIKIIDGVLAIGGDVDWALHTTDIATTTTDVTEANKLGATTINDVCVKANGDNAGEYSLVIAHSTVANHLADLQLLEFLKYTDANGITRNLPIGTINGKTLIVNDNVTVKPSETADGEKEYTTYILGNGAIRYAEAPVDIPSELDRDPAKNGGKDFLYTRLREVLHPYGFHFKGDHATNVGITDAVLTASESYERKLPAKAIFMAKVVSNG